MDTRRHLIGRDAPARLIALAFAGLVLSSCASLRPSAPQARPPIISVARLEPAKPAQTPLPAPSNEAATPDLAREGARPPLPPPPSPPPRVFTAMAPIPNPAPPAKPRPERDDAPRAVDGRDAIREANRQARAASRPEQFVGGIQVFRYEPGRLFEVWTAPLRVTTLSLAPGETIVSKAAGDTVRWQIGETNAGDDASRQALVMIKPLEAGLETNLVIATNRRVYQLILRSGRVESFNPAISWDLATAAPIASPAPPEPPAAAAPTPQTQPAAIAMPSTGLDARYRIAARGRTPSWAPTAVMTDGVRTFLTFPPGLAVSEAPVLFVRGLDGEIQLVNYRQQAGLWVVDRVVEQGELRLGDRKRETVHFTREAGLS